MADKQAQFLFHHPNAPRPNVPLQPGVCAVIHDSGGRVLLIRRTDGPYWCLPGGRIDIGESAAICCQREVYEETGLTVSLVRIIGIYTDPASICVYPDGNIHQSFVIGFETKVEDGSLNTSDESSAVEWFPPEEALKLNLIPDSRLCLIDLLANQTTAFIR